MPLPVLALFGVGVLLLSQALPCAATDRHRKYKAPPPTAHIEVTVVRGSNGKPVHNAAVIFHPMKHGKDQGGMELKTNEQGKAVLDVVPIGTAVLLQVIANGYRTYGQEYAIDGDSKTILVKLEEPQGQYSTYKKGGGLKDESQNAPQAQMGQAAPTYSPRWTPPPKKKD
jgi:hypothetical protein